MDLIAQMVLSNGKVASTQRGYTRQRGDSRPVWMEWDGMRFHYATQNGAQFKTYNLFISGIFYIIFSDWGWSQVTETLENKTTDKEGLP